MQVYIGVEGYMLSQGFIAKELAILYTNEEFEHHVFKPPQGVSLSKSDANTVRYVTRNINHLSYSDGITPYNTLSNIFDTVKNDIIYTYGYIAEKFIQDYLPTTVVINIQSRNFKLPMQLPISHCSRVHPPRYCALAKAYAVKCFIE